MVLTTLCTGGDWTACSPTKTATPSIRTRADHTRHSPWEWEGLQCIEETGTPVKKLAYSFNARGLLSADEQHNYRAQISKADGSPLTRLARLYDIVDSDRDGTLSVEGHRTAAKMYYKHQALTQGKTILAPLLKSYYAKGLMKRLSFKSRRLSPLL